MEFTAKHSILTQLGFENVKCPTFKCGYCDFFCASSPIEVAIAEITKHVTQDHPPEKVDISD